MKDGPYPSWLQILNLIETRVPDGFKYLFHQTVDPDGDALPIERMRQFWPDHVFRLWAVEGLTNQFSHEDRLERLKQIAALPPADFNRWWREEGIFFMSRGLFIGVVWNLWPETDKPTYEEIDAVLLRDSKIVSHLAVQPRSIVMGYIENYLMPELAQRRKNKLSEILGKDSGSARRGLTTKTAIGEKADADLEKARTREATSEGFQLWKEHKWKGARTIAQKMVQSHFPEIKELTGQTKFNRPVKSHDYLRLVNNVRVGMLRRRPPHKKKHTRGTR